MHGNPNTDIDGKPTNRHYRPAPLRLSQLLCGRIPKGIRTFDGAEAKFELPTLLGVVGINDGDVIEKCEHMPHHDVSYLRSWAPPCRP